MQPSAFGTTQRSIANRQLKTILAAGLGSSIVLHVGLIAGIVQWWQPQVKPEESIAVTLVAPVETPALSRSPAVTPRPKPVRTAKIQTRPASVTKSTLPTDRTPTPAPVKLPSTSIATTTKLTPLLPLAPSRSSRPTAPQQQLKSPATIPNRLDRQQTTTATPIPTPRAIPSPPIQPAFDLPIPAEPRSIGSSPSPTPPPKIAALPKPQQKSVPQTFDRQTAEKPDRTPTPPPVKKVAPPTDRSTTKTTPTIPLAANNNQNSIAPLQPRNTDLVAAPSSKPIDTARAAPPTRENNTKQNLPPLPIDRPMSNTDKTPNRGDTGAGNGRSAPEVNRPTLTPQAGANGGDGGNLPGNTTTLNLPSQTTAKADTDTGTGTGSKTTAKADTDTGTGTGAGKLVCIKYCEVPQLQDVRDTDGGKDRLRIRIVVDAAGIVTDAKIAKSSGNPQVDAAALAGIGQMQFAPSGKQISGIIRANILIRSTRPISTNSIA